MGYQSAWVFGGSVFPNANHFLHLWGENSEDESVCADLNGASRSMGQLLDESTSK